MDEPIYFYDPDDDWGFLSNLAPYGFTWEGRIWPTAEHYYQAHKFKHNPELFEKIAAIRNPFEVKGAAHDHEDECAPNWREETCLLVMRLCNREKFKQNPEIAAQLKATGDRLIIERVDSDAFWGDGPDGDGHNWAGKILMEVRDQLGR